MLVLVLLQVVDKLQASGKSKRDGWRTELPRTGLGEGVIGKMKEEKQKDVVWQGKCSGTVYVGIPSFCFCMLKDNKHCLLSLLCAYN